MGNDLLSITEAAEYAGVSRPTIYVWIRDGRRYRRRLYYLTAEIHRGQTRIRLSTFNRFLDHVGYEIEEDESDQDESDQE